jgi:hypothetical protein
MTDRSLAILLKLNTLIHKADNFRIGDLYLGLDYRDEENNIRNHRIVGEELERVLELIERDEPIRVKSPQRDCVLHHPDTALTKEDNGMKLKIDEFHWMPFDKNKTPGCVVQGVTNSNRRISMEFYGDECLEVVLAWRNATWYSPKGATNLRPLQPLQLPPGVIEEIPVGPVNELVGVMGASDFERRIQRRLTALVFVGVVFTSAFIYFGLFR